MSGRNGRYPRYLLASSDSGSESPRSATYHRNHWRVLGPGSLHQLWFRTSAAATARLRNKRQHTIQDEQGSPPRESFNGRPDILVLLLLRRAVADASGSSDSARPTYETVAADPAALASETPSGFRLPAASRRVAGARGRACRRMLPLASAAEQGRHEASHARTLCLTHDLAPRACPCACPVRGTTTQSVDMYSSGSVANGTHVAFACPQISAAQLDGQGTRG